MAGEATNTSASACVDAGGFAVGMPQLCTEWMLNQVFWLVIALVAIYLILTRIALPRIAAVLAERVGTVTNDLASAEELKMKAEEAEAAYEKARADARAEAQAIVAETRAEIQKDLDKAIAEADAEIAARAAESEKAIAEIRASAVETMTAVAKETALDIVSAVSPVDADAKAIDKAVAERVKG